MSERLSKTSLVFVFTIKMFAILLFSILLLATILFIYWNESNFLKISDAIKQIKEIVILAPNSQPNIKNDFKVIYYSGYVSTNDFLKDNFFGIAVKAIKLERRVEMYQWKKFGGGYRSPIHYDPVWSDKLIDSNEFPFGYENPNHMFLQSTNQQASNVYVDNFNLSPETVEKITNKVFVNVTDNTINNVHKNSKLKIQQVGNNYYYLGNNPNTPHVGDMRVSLYYVLPQVISVIAEQNGKLLQPITVPNGERIVLVVPGKVSVSQMIHNSLLENQYNAWFYRIISLLFMCFCALVFTSVITSKQILMKSLKIGVLLWVVFTILIFISVRL